MKLVDSTPIPLGKWYDWAKSNGRIRGVMMHVVFDPKADCPRILDITDANVNDAQIGRAITIEPGTSYVFDKGYGHYGWGTAIADREAASKKKGMWMGGVPPLGYRAQDGKLVIEDSEAETVRFIFRRYVELASVRLLKDELDARSQQG